MNYCLIKDVWGDDFCESDNQKYFNYNSKNNNTSSQIIEEEQQQELQQEKSNNINWYKKQKKDILKQIKVENKLRKNYKNILKHNNDLIVKKLSKLKTIRNKIKPEKSQKKTNIIKGGIPINTFHNIINNKQLNNIDYIICGIIFIIILDIFYNLK